MEENAEATALDKDPADPAYLAYGLKSAGLSVQLEISFMHFLLTIEEIRKGGEKRTKRRREERKRLEIIIRVPKHYVGRTRFYFHPKMSIIIFYLVLVFYTENSISIRMPTISMPSVVFIILQEVECCIKLSKHDLTLAKHSR